VATKGTLTVKNDGGFAQEGAHPQMLSLGAGRSLS